MTWQNLLWVMVAILVVGMLVLVSTMRLRQSDNQPMFMLDTDPTKKKSIKLGHLIIDLSLVVVFIVGVLYLWDNWYYVASWTLAFLIISRPYYKPIIGYVQSVAHKSMKDSKEAERI